MKKIPLLFLFFALLVGCENSATDMDLPTEATSAGQDRLAAQDATGTTINFYLEDETTMASDATLTMNFYSVFHWFDGSIVCSTSWETNTPTNVSWSPAQLAYGEFPMETKLEVNMAGQGQEISATVSFQGGSTSEMVVTLTNQGNNKYVAEFDLFTSEFCQKLQSMFSQMGDQMTECTIRVKINKPKEENSFTGSWVSSLNTVVVTAKYPVESNMIVEYLIVNTTGSKVYPTDRDLLMLTIPKGETTARAYLPDFVESQPPALIVIYRVNPEPNSGLISGAWRNMNKQVVLTLQNPVPWTLEVDYFIINPIGYKVYPTDYTVLTLTIPRGQTSASAYLPGFEETQPPSQILISNIRIKSSY